MRPTKGMFFLFLLFMLYSSSAQNTTASPSAEILAAAASAFPEYDSGPTFDTILKSGSNFPNPIIIPRTFDTTPGGSVFRAPSYPSPHLTRLVGRSDFVGVGVPLKRWTVPLSGNTFAASIYLVHITSPTVLGKESISAGSDIYVVRAGGPFSYEGHAFRAIDPNFHLFHLNQPYLFFGSRIISGLYKVDSDGSLQIDGSRVSETSQKQHYAKYYEGKTLDTVLQEALDAWSLKTEPERRQK